MTKLPDLPRKNKRLEAKHGQAVALWLWKHHPHKNWAMEAKVKGGRLLKHQKVALRQVEDGKFPPQKIPDMGRQNPFDYYCLGDADAIVCVIDVDKRRVHCEVNDGVTKYDFRLPTKKAP